MPLALSVDLREQVIEAVKAGSSRRQAAERFGVGKAGAIRWHARFGDRGEIAPKPAGGDRSPPAIEAYAETILEICRVHPQIFLRELRDTLVEQGNAASGTPTATALRALARSAAGNH